MRRSVIHCLCAGTVLAIAAAGTGCKFTPRPPGQTNGTGGNNGGEVPGSGGWTANLDALAPLTDAPREYISAPDVGEETGPSADANCGNQPFQVVIPPPNLLILLDRSQSMTEDATGELRPAPLADQKWTLVTQAINQVVAATESNIKWGLMYFGSDSACGVAAMPVVPPSLMNAQMIASAIAGTQPQSYTPTTKGVLAAGNYLSTFPDMGRKFILLATDGQPTCGGNGNSTSPDDPAAIQAVTTVAGMQIPTYVIGIATTDSPTADATLNSMAEAGGQPRAATPKYYPVMNTADLVTALDDIKTIVMGMCTYPLGTPDANADLERTVVTVDGKAVPRTDPNGWDFDPGNASITFKGTMCADLMAGRATKVQVLYGCKTIVI